MLKKRPLIIVGIFVVILAVFIIKTANLYPFLFQLFFDKGVALKETNSRVNILLLGIGGGRHDGPNLTDTIILASLDPKNNKITLVSIPRDLWVPDLELANKKINGAYAAGEEKRKGGGLLLAKKIVEKISGQNVDYGLRIDFSGFVKAVDIVGGLDVMVDNSFVDSQYPISGKEDDPCGKTEEELQTLATASAEILARELPCRYKYLRFDKGLARMDGETALEFVRSRNSESNEGSDFARSKRQEKVIKAFKDKILSAQTLINPAKILNLYSVLKDSIDTDIKQDEFDDFIRLAQEMKQVKIQSVIIDAGDEQAQRQGLLINPPITSDYNLEWVLIPRLGNGNFTEIQKYIDCKVKTENCPVFIKPQS